MASIQMKFLCGVDQKLFLCSLMQGAPTGFKHVLHINTNMIHCSIDRAGNKRIILFGTKNKPMSSKEAG